MPAPGTALSLTPSRALLEKGYRRVLLIVARGVIALDNILQAVGNVGFPIAVTAYLLMRIESKLEALASSIARLAEAVGE